MARNPWGVFEKFGVIMNLKLQCQTSENCYHCRHNKNLPLREVVTHDKANAGTMTTQISLIF